MAAIPSSGSLLATHDYYRRRLGSTSRNSSCGSAEYPGKPSPTRPGLPKAYPGRWWASFFFGKSTLPFMATVLESPEHSESPQTSTCTITCDLAREDVGKQQPGGQPGKTNSGPCTDCLPPAARLHFKARCS
ncbi:pancreatic progenitor cell differentiation and proliferation factor-like [Camelus ferus]|uniref:Pancreatic progenitor cell differentiation and proliferation factor-like n=1 Tax=Camelus ferus TaxID=419612 RepID=S9YI29_CAMFR|nr:pancreatic progenitor cell differentiation and proliferation factor-like [Camelus ferus]EPY83775.1 pancreatic progenitor cell differentiation and proliferation factor [Camelus ferus]